MAAYLIRRLWQMVPTLIGVLLLVFFLFKTFGGDPAEILGGLNGKFSRKTTLPAACAISIFTNAPCAGWLMRYGRA